MTSEAACENGKIVIRSALNHETLRRARRDTVYIRNQSARFAREYGAMLIAGVKIQGGGREETWCRIDNSNRRCHRRLASCRLGKG
jgi:hypothetical protein